MTTNLSTALFDDRGVRIPYYGLKNAVTAPDWNFHLDLPVMETRVDFEKRLVRFWQFVPDSFADNPSEFWNISNIKYKALCAHPTLCGLLNGPCLPIVIPTGIINDYGCYLEELILPAVEASYRSIRPGHKLIIQIGGKLANQVSIVPESNYPLLTAPMEAGQIVGLYFPDALRGWSIEACREQMATLPLDVKIILPDAIIHGMALIGYPDSLAGWYAPGLDCAANTWQTLQLSLDFKGSDGGLSFGTAHNVACAHACYSGGLLIV